MISTTYSDDIVTSKDISRYVTAQLNAICEACPARKSPDMYDLCTECRLTSDDRQDDMPRDTRDYMK